MKRSKFIGRKYVCEIHGMYFEMYYNVRFFHCYCYHHDIHTELLRSLSNLQYYHTSNCGDTVLCDNQTHDRNDGIFCS